MPVNLTKMMQKATSYPKVTFNAHYFHKDLTGMGKKVGLINQKTDSIVELTKFQQAVPDFLTQPQNHRELRIIFNDNKDDIDKQRFDHNNQPGRYNLIKKHTYLTSVIDPFIKNIDEAIEYRHTYFTKKELPAIFKNIKFNAHSNIPNLNIGAIVNDIKYFKFNNQKNDNPKEQFFFSLVPAIKINGKNHEKTDVIVNPTNITMMFDIINKQIINQKLPNNDLIVILNQNDGSSANSFNAYISSEIKQLKLSTILKQQAEDTEKKLFNDLPELMKLTRSDQTDNNQKRIHQKLISDNYHLFKLQDSRRDANDYQLLYNRIKTITLKYPVNKPNANGYSTFDFNQLINCNTRLSLTRQLHLLKNDSKVYQFKPSQAQLQTNEKYSPEQLAIIHSTAPYSVGVAGAGSGKSHTLIGRLSFLQQNNVDFHHVLVTSFTNTAAQNIIDRFHGGINSLTNANLFHKIYQANFSHVLTNEETLINLLSVLPSNSAFMRKNATINQNRLELIDCLRRSISNGFQKVDAQSVTEHLVNLVSQNFDNIITILNAVGQTTLLIEPIVISTMMQSQRPLNYPSNLQNLNFILTDESQDTSAFEYVLILQLAHLNHAQLMIIGDANQTLYEFRNANPRFLNTLERSDVFKTYTMSTNYRSKQDVLSLANQFLDVMTTNETANIQLHANLFEKVTLDTFKDHVRLSNIVPDVNQRLNVRNYETNKQALLRQTVSQNQELKQWVLEKYQNHEQIAIMAYRNRDTQAIADAVSDFIKDAKGTEPEIGYTRKATRRADTWLSQAMTFEDTQLSKQKHITVSDIENSLMDRLNTVAKRRSHGAYSYQPSKTSVDIVNRFVRSRGLNSHLQLFNQGQISYNKLNGFIMMKLIKAETFKNNTSRLLQENHDTKWQNKPIVVSTIHSAKGLEFPNVICYFDETMNGATSQENLRLYGVALTRAENNEFILNRPKTVFVPNTGRKLPTNIDDQLTGMFKTPMRTAYQRVLLNLKSQQTDNN